MEEIERGIFYENSYPGVTLGAIIQPHATIMIDAPLRAEDGRSWRSVLLNRGGDSNRILVNIDAHPDRTLGARAMECTIIAHQKTAQVFRGRPSVFKGQNVESGAEWETHEDVVGARWAMPDITFQLRIYMYWGGDEVILEHHPGPAAGAIWVLVPSTRVVFVGDAVLVSQPPFLSNADIPTWTDSLDTLIDSYSGYTIVSGRGGPVTLEAIREQRKQLKMILKQIDQLARRNVSSEHTERLIPKLVSEFNFSPENKELYTQRLRHGLHQYYSRRYRPSEPVSD